MGPSYTRREFLSRAAMVGGGAMALQIVPATALAGHATPLTRHHDPDVLLRWVQGVWESVKRERYTPPNAARTYGYFSVAAYEAVVGGMPRHRSLGGQLNDLGRLPSAPSGPHIDWPAAANAAMASIVPVLFAGRDTSLAELDALAGTIHGERYAAVGHDAAERGAKLGRKVGAEIAAWIERDGWADIQGLPYTPPVGPGLWQSTPPNFGTAIEPYWEQVRPFALDPVTVCTPVPPVPFSTEVGSEFHAQAMTTYEAVLNLTEDQRQTALFWRDNPDGTTGLPSGHWTLITAILVRQLGLDLARAAEVFALHGIALADGFTSCWTEKYRTNLVRPVTYINAHIDPTWVTPVNTPQFPEYTSGHSVGSGAAAATLTALLGEVAFTDDTGLANGFAPRSFGSPWEAANEAAISRLYGGIHYPMGISAGIEQGACVSAEVLGRVRTRKGRFLTY